MTSAVPVIGVWAQPQISHRSTPPSQSPQFCPKSRKSWEEVFLVQPVAAWSRARASWHAAAQLFVHSPSTRSFHRVRHGRSQPWQHPVRHRRVWPSNSGALSSVGRTKYQLPHRAPPTKPGNGHHWQAGTRSIRGAFLPSCPLCSQSLTMPRQRDMQPVCCGVSSRHCRSALEVPQQPYL